MDSIFVIKVKYNDALRRFNATINENGQLALDMNALRAKIFSLFGFPHDADVTLTYVDEDGDIVWLVDNNDLSDVTRQSLKFVRINVQLNNGKGPKNNARNSANSSPKTSPHVQNPLPNSNIGDTKWLKSVPDPVREALVQLQDALSKLSLVSASTPPTSVPVAAEPFTHSTKSPFSFFNQAQQSQGGKVASSQAGAAKVAAASSVAKKQNASAPSATPFSFPFGHNGSTPSAAASGISTSSGSPFAYPSSGIRTASYSAVPSQVPPPIGPLKSEIFQNYDGSNLVTHNGVKCDGCGANPIVGVRYKSRVKWDNDLCSSCFARMGNEADYFKIERPPTNRVDMFPSHPSQTVTFS